MMNNLLRINFDVVGNAQNIVNLLNDMFRLDPEATRELCSHRVQLNEAAMNSDLPVIVQGDTLGMIGFLNGMFSETNRVAMDLDVDGNITGFRVVDLTSRDEDGFECEYCLRTATYVKPDETGLVWGYCDDHAPEGATVFDGTLKPGTVLEIRFTDFLVGVDKPLPEVKIANHWGEAFKND